MDPDGRAGPCRSPQSYVPRCRRGGGVDDPVQGVERGAGRSVSLFQRYATAGGRAARQMYPVQGGDELRDVRCQRTRVGEKANSRVLAVQPPVDGPVPRIALSGFAVPERHGNGDRKERGKPRQPLLLLVHIVHSPMDPGESHGHVLPEPIHRVVSPRGGDGHERKVGPLRELRREQSAHERRIRVDFVDVHLAGGESISSS